MIFVYTLHMGFWDTLRNIFGEEIKGRYTLSISRKGHWPGKTKCYFCKAEYTGLQDKFSCKYCRKYFCAKHRLPELHECKGNPKQPKGTGFREVHTKAGIYVKYKE